MQKIELRLPELHNSQREVAADSARFKVLACGRRWGKTRLGALWCVAVAARGGRAWWVAPSYKMAAPGWRLIRQLAMQIPGVEKNESRLIVELPSGGWAQVRSADDPESLRGEGLNAIVIDECAFIQERTWISSLRPALSDRLGKAMFISTPHGRNWFFRLYQRGNGAGQANWKSWRYPTQDNPFIDPDEVRAARDDLPERIFEQEYMAEFLEHEGAVFRNIRKCINAVKDARPEDHEEHRVVMGADWGKQNDFTALSVVCADCGQELALDRFNKIDYVFQRGRLRVLYDRFNVKGVLAEENSIGVPVIEELVREGIRVEPFQTTPSSKPKLIENLALALEREECQWIDNPVATGEMQSYEREVSEVTGRSRYSAPSGVHDDTVIARALAWRAVTTFRPFMIAFA